MRRKFYVILFVAALLPTGITSGEEARISIRLDSYADRTLREAPFSLLSLPPEQSRASYRGESIVYLPGEKARVTVEIPPVEEAPEGEITLLCLVSGDTHVLHRGGLRPGTYGPYETAISADFEVYQVQVRAGDRTVTKGFYGIRPWRGMKDFSEEISPNQILLAYEKPADSGFEKTTPWDLALKEGGVPLDVLDANWALGSHPGKAGSVEEQWWLWTHYACGMLGLQSGRTGLPWGEYDPWTRPARTEYTLPLNASRTYREVSVLLPPHFSGLCTDGMPPCEIFLRERIQPVLRKWALNLSERHPNEPLTISLDDDWGIGRGIGRRFGPEILRFFVSWMKEQFGITIQAETFKDLIEKCQQYPKHFQYFVARNTTMRSLELTCEAVQDVVATSKAWSKDGESNRRLVALPEAAEFCQILARCIAVGTSDDPWAWALRDSGGNPLPYSMSNMVIKALAPDHNFCVGWNGCPPGASDGETYQWYLEPAWTTAYDDAGNLRHLYTHSPPAGPDSVWRSLIEFAEASDEKILLHDKCFQLMEAIGVEKPLGPVFVCKDWTFTDDKLGHAFRSDLYEQFLISLRRHKVPISCAVHADNESAAPADLPRVYAPRMSGPDKIRLGFKAGSAEKWFTCDASGIPDSLLADFAARLNAASGNPIVFPPKTSIEGYAFEARGMKFVIAEEMAGRNQHGNIKVKVGPGRWKVIDIIAAKAVPSKKEGEYLVFEASLDPNSATLYCAVPGSGK